MKRKTLKKNPIYRYRNVKKAGKIEKTNEEVADTFLDDNSPVIEDAFVSQPSIEDVREVVSEFDGYRDYVNRESGNNLTYGDY